MSHSKIYYFPYRKPTYCQNLRNFWRTYTNIEKGCRTVSEWSKDSQHFLYLLREVSCSSLELPPRASPFRQETVLSVANSSTKLEEEEKREEKRRWWRIVAIWRRRIREKKKINKWERRERWGQEGWRGEEDGDTLAVPCSYFSFFVLGSFSCSLPSFFLLASFLSLSVFFFSFPYFRFPLYQTWIT